MLLAPPTPATYVLVDTDASIEEISSQARAFNWKRPSCPCGSGKVWGHGYVRRCFAALSAPLLLKRFRCRHCRTVFTLIPRGYERRYQTAAQAIGAAMVSRLTHRGWPRGLPRQRGGHWLRRFLRTCRMDLPSEDPLTALRRILDNGLPLLV